MVQRCAAGDANAHLRFWLPEVLRLWKSPCWVHLAASFSADASHSMRLRPRRLRLALSAS